jgi:hypothetical protein
LVAVQKYCPQLLVSLALCVVMLASGGTAVAERPHGDALQVELQGVSLTVLSFFRNEHESAQLADIVASYQGILGAAVCCSEDGGLVSDDWTTCEDDRDQLLDR